MSPDGDDFDIEAFRPRPGTYSLEYLEALGKATTPPPGEAARPDKITTSAPGRAKKKSAAPFVKVPLSWVVKLQEARSAATWLVAHHVLYEWWRKGEPVTISNVAFPSLGRWQKTRAVAELEALGLVKVERRGRKSPRVTILPV